MPHDFEGYLQQISFPRLSVIQRQKLDAPLTIEELQEAVSSLPTCKAPRENGIIMDIYKQYTALIPQLSVFNASLERQALPLSMFKANIVLLKASKNLVDPGSY